MDDSEFDRTSHFFAAMDVRLEETRELLSNTPESQRADFLITKQWMRMILWKRAMFNVELSTDIADGSLSISFPEQLARNVMTYINDFPRAIVQAHGLGMVSREYSLAVKKTDIDLSLANETSRYRNLLCRCFVLHAVRFQKLSAHAGSAKRYLELFSRVHSFDTEQC